MDRAAATRRFLRDDGSRKHMLKGRIHSYFDDREITLKTLTAADVEDFYEILRDAGLKGTTLVHYHQFMNQALESAVKKDLLVRNPMYKVDRPRRSLFVGSYYSKEEVEKLLEVLKDDPLYPMVFVDVYYGLRRSELLGLDLGQHRL
jgi:integrase